jgi:hypothetical protein
MSEMSCTTMRELAPELALDVLTGYERATAQAHLGMCPQCREYVSSLTQIGDRLLTLVPGAEPPVGFEDRVMQGIGFPAQRATRPPRRRWWPMAVAAAAIVAVVFGIGGWAVANLTDHSTDMRFAQFRGRDDRQIGQVFTYGGTPPWVYMSVTDATATTVTCQLMERNGKIVSIGSFELSGGKGIWGHKVDVDPSTVIGARLVTDHGAVLATATFGS